MGGYLHKMLRKINKTAKSVPVLPHLTVYFGNSFPFANLIPIKFEKPESTLSNLSVPHLSFPISLEQCRLRFRTSVQTGSGESRSNSFPFPGGGGDAKQTERRGSISEETKAFVPELLVCVHLKVKSPISYWIWRQSVVCIFKLNKCSEKQFSWCGSVSCVY